MTPPDIPFSTIVENLRVHLAYFLAYGQDWGDDDDHAWAAVHDRLIDGHGTRGKYQGHRAGAQKGCRCDLCKEAQHRFNIRPEVRERKSRWAELRKDRMIELAMELEGEEEL